MGADSKIEWTHHTFNPWWGCVKVSPGCEHCYAETFAKRTGNKVWGSAAPRRFFGDKHWQEPLKWDLAAKDAGERHRVFCASMADVFEDRADLIAPRSRLLSTIHLTDHLDWLLLTKRPENVNRLMPSLPANVWISTTVEDQKRADQRIPVLLNIDARVRFLSCEPLLERIHMPSKWLSPLMQKQAPWITPDPLIHWVICGGESGPGKRPFNADWARSLRDQCLPAGVPFFMKQMDKVLPIPGDLMIREFPQPAVLA